MAPRRFWSEAGTRAGWCQPHFGSRSEDDWTARVARVGLRVSRAREPSGTFLGPTQLMPKRTDRDRPDPTRTSMARIRRHRRDIVQSPLETYLREINEMALLTADEEKM